VKQVDDNYTWLYNENEYLKVELSDFCNYGEMLLNSVAHFTKAALVTRQLITPRHTVPKSVISNLFGSIDITYWGAPI